MFEPKRSGPRRPTNYVGVRLTDAEEAWLRAEMKRRKIATMSDLIRFALNQLRDKP